MKKLFALMLALCLLCSVAMAEDTLSWENVAETAAQIEGEFHTFDEIAVKIWIPAVLKEAELADEYKEAGYIGYFVTEDQTAAVAVMYVNAEGLSLEEYNAYLVNEAGVDEKTIEPGTVNGLDCLSYEYNGSGVLAFTTQMGYILEVSGSPLTDENFTQTLSIIMASIQAAE